MKILLLAGPYLAVPPYKYGGTERVVYELIKGLHELGHDVTLMASGDSRVPCRLISIIEKATEFKDLKDDATKDRVAQYLAEEGEKYDVIHNHWQEIEIPTWLPQITTLHCPINEKTRGKNLITISQDMGRGSNLDIIGTVYNGLDPREMEYGEGKGNYVCFLGRADYQKNPHRAIEWAKKAGIKIKLGAKVDDSQKEYFEKEITPYLADADVEWLGEVGGQEKNDLLKNAIANLHPIEFREPFGLTVLEAAYCGTPTVAYGIGSMPELIEDGKTGLLANNDTEAVAAIRKCTILGRKEISRKAREKFNYKKMALDYVEMYQKVRQLVLA